MPLPRPLDPFTQRLAELLPALHSVGSSRKYASERQRVLSGYILDALLGLRRKHLTEPDAVFFEWKALCSDLHCDRTAATVDSLILPFFERANDFSVGRGIARSYRLRSAVIKAARHALDAHPTQSAPRARRLQHDLDDAPPYLARIPPVLSEVTEEVVRRAFQQPKAKTQREQDWEKLILQTVRASGGLPNTFAVASNGRLAPQHRVHLVSMPREIRERLLTALGWIDYDIQSCHLSIFRDLCRSWSSPVLALDGYLAAKSTHHAEWSAAIGHDAPDDFKGLVLATLTGSILSSSPHTAVGRTLGPAKALAWIGLPDVRELYAEIRAGARVISHPDSPADYRANAAMKMLRVDPRKPGKTVSHILTGLEQWAVASIIPEFPPETVKTVVYDGWITSGGSAMPELKDLSALLLTRSRIAHKLPLKLSIKQHQFGSPTLVLDPWDF